MITLGVQDLKRAIRFYEEGLGLPRKPFEGDIAFFELKGSCFGPVVLIIDVGFLSLDVFGLGVPGVFSMIEFSFLVISFLLFFSILLNGPDLFGSLRRVKV